MLFNSWVFLALLTLTAGLYPVAGRFRDGRRAQIWLLIGASLVFYSWENPILVFLLVGSITANVLIADRMIRARDQGRTRRVRTLMVSGVVVNLALLAWFKYAALLARALLPGGLYASVGSNLEDIPLPVGISFYTFQGLSLIFDLATGHSGLESLDDDRRRGPLAFAEHIALYIAFFPQLVAGPIVKAHDFLGQVGRKFFSDVDWTVVVRQLAVGFFLKMVVADNLKEVTVLLNQGDFEGMSKIALVALAVGYSAQIFADFAGYSTIAIGLAGMFGYRLKINFDFPYNSASITEFWRRWHISLSSWLRDYLYIPLGGNRRGTTRTYVNLMIVMGLGGLWHGASWNFAVWGLAHGLLLAVERLLFGADVIDRARTGRLRHVRVALVFGVVSLLWLLFLLPDFATTADYFSALATAPLGVSDVGLGAQTLYVLVVFTLPVGVYHLWGATPRLRRAVLSPAPASVPLRWVEATATASLLFLILTNAGTPGEFIYFQF